MDVYYRKLMANGSVASKFKLDKRAYQESRGEPNENASPDSLSQSSCARCHRMKMRCSRTMPQCENCSKRQVLCEYSLRRESADRSSSAATVESDRKSVDVPITGITSGTHHSSCVRCYKSKKKCSRTFPMCDTCQKASAECQYVERRRKKPKVGQVETEDSHNHESQMENLESQMENPESKMANPESKMENPESSMENPESVMENSVSSMENPESSIPRKEPSISQTPPIHTNLLERTSISRDVQGAGVLSTSPSSLTIRQNGDFTSNDSEPFRNIDLPVYVGETSRQSSEPPSQSFRGRAQKRPFSVAQKVVASAIPSHSSGNLEEEFLVVRRIKDPSLPSLFVHTFFANYEWRYPFLSRPTYIQKLQGISFVNETFVQLDIYMVMAIGCLIYDTNYNTKHYTEYFSDSLIESMVDIISYDIKSEEDLHKAHLLILLSIYAINVCNLKLIWNIVGFLNRLIVFMTDFSSRSDTYMKKRCFWTIFNLDKELSLVLNKLSQFIPTQIIRSDAQFQESLLEGEPEAIATLMSSAVALHKLQDRMVSLKMGLLDKNQEVLTQFSADLEAWRVSISSLIRKEYSESALLPNFIGLVNLDYYYLLIELDQLSSTESLQFTLQFLSNSFSLLLSESNEKKHADATSTYSLFWFVKFFKVIDYSVDSLPRILCPDLSKADLSLRLNEFNSNSQLIVNLLKFLLNTEMKPARFVDRLEMYVEKLRVMNTKLATFNPLVSSGETIKRMGNELVEEFIQTPRD